MDFEEMKEKHKDSEDFISTLTAIESEFTALSGKKETAVEKEIKLRGGKQEIAKALGLDESTPMSELVAKVGETLTGYKTKIDSFEKTASSKELESAGLKEDFANMKSQMADYASKLEQEQAKTKLNSITDLARTALNGQRITDKGIQDTIIRANMSDLSTMDASDFDSFAKATAEQTPAFTDTVHKGGSGTTGATYNNNNASNLGNIDPKDSKARTQAIQARLEAQGLA